MTTIHNTKTKQVKMTHRQILKKNWLTYQHITKFTDPKNKGEAYTNLYNTTSKILKTKK